MIQQHKIQQYKEALKGFFKNQVDVSLFWKGRVALYAILKAIGLRENDEVILPAFTCVVVANPVLYLGAVPVYVDIDPATYNMDAAKIEEKITNKTRAILAQNTFGLSSDIDSISEIADRYNLWVIEDCAHGFGGTYKGKPNGTIADASFFSTQWNKPFSTGLGGIALSKRAEISDKLKSFERQMETPGKRDELVLQSLLFAHERLLGPDVYWPALKLYRFLSRHNLVLGSSQGFELEKPEQPKNFLKGFTRAQAGKGIIGLRQIERNIEHRKKIAGLYTEILAGLGVEPPYVPEYSTHTFLKYPLLVERREEFVKMAERNRIELGDWFVSPIHPITARFELWNYTWGSNPIAEGISKKIVNLPTHQNIDERYVDRVSAFLKRYQKYLIRRN